MRTPDLISVDEAARMFRGEPHFVYSLILNGFLKAAGPSTPTI